MRILHAAFAFSLLTTPAIAGADNKKPGDGKAPAADGKAGVPGAKVASDSDKKPSTPPKKEETIDDIMERATQPPPDQTPPAEVKPEVKDPKATDPKATDPKAKTQPPPVKPTKPNEPPPPPTDDNDSTTEAARPTALTAVAPTSVPRKPGPYELGPLDCRVLDGAGIERLLPKKIVAGEEPDILCRVLITQPATVQLAPHELTLTVMLGAKATFQQVRQVRMSSVGRRAVVFLVPADRISSEDLARVTMRASLSQPATPAVREVKFTVEPAD